MRSLKRVRRSIAAQRGASTTEAQVVLVFGLLIAGGAVAVLAPGLGNALIDALAPLGVSAKLDDGAGGAGAGWYVVFALLTVGFFALLVAPMLFPKARQKREEVISDVTGSFKIRDVFADRDRRADRGVAELRNLNDEIKKMQGTPMGGLPAARPNRDSEEPGIAIDAAGVGASEEPTVSRDRPTELPQLEPLVPDPGEEPTATVAPANAPAHLGEPFAPNSTPGDNAPVLRSLKGVRAADYKAPEPIVGDEDNTNDLNERPRFPIDDPDESTNIYTSDELEAGQLLAQASQMEAGPDDATALHAELQEDLRKTIEQDAEDPAGRDATTRVYVSKDD